MFNINQKVICLDADNQPRLQLGKEYTVWAVEGERGIRVATEAGRIQYSYNLDRFEAVHVADEVKWTQAILILNENAYAVMVNPDEDDQCSRIRDMRFMSVGH